MENVEDDGKSPGDLGRPLGEESNGESPSASPVPEAEESNEESAEDTLISHAELLLQIRNGYEVDELAQAMIAAKAKVGKMTLKRANK